jgi:hypothetical protein
MEYHHFNFHFVHGGICDVFGVGVLSSGLWAGPAGRGDAACRKKNLITW